MGKLLKIPEGPQEDPQTKALREQERRRAEEDKTRAAQEQLSLESRIRGRQFGFRSLLGGLTGGPRLNSLLGAG